MSMNSHPRVRVAAVLLFVVVAWPLHPSANATAVKPKKTVAKRKVTVRTTTTPLRKTTTTTTLKAATTTIAPAVPVSSKDRVLAGYESYFTAFVGAARQPERAKELLTAGMTGDALTRLLEIRRLDAADGVYWDGKRADIISAPKVEQIGDTTATLRDCQSIGGVLRKKATGAIVPATTERDVDDVRVTLVIVDDRWLVTSVDRFNDVEGRSKCVPGSLSP